MIPHWKHFPLRFEHFPFFHKACRILHTGPIGVIFKSGHFEQNKMKKFKSEARNPNSETISNDQNSNDSNNKNICANYVFVIR